MIKNLENLGVTEQTEIHKSDTYKEIQSSGSNYEDSLNYWGDIFAAKDVFDDKMYYEMFNYLEEDFNFDFDKDNPELQKQLELFSSDKWEHFTEEEKFDVMERFVNNLCELLGIEESPLLRLYEADECNCGAFNSYSNTIDINRNILNDPNEVVDTLAHEIRHAYQYQRASICETDTDKLYDFNFKHYIVPEYVDGHCVNYLDYQDQFIEVEARAFANLVRNGGMTNE